MLLGEFLEKVHVSPLDKQKPSSGLAETIYSRVGPVTPGHSLAYAVSKVGALVANYFYPLHSDRAKFLIGLYTALYLVLDDVGPAMVPDIARFRQRLLQPNRDQPEIFDLLATVMEGFDREFSTPCANKLFVSVINSLSSLEIEYDRSASFTAKASPSFPKYFRNMNGSSEAYVFFLLPGELYSMQRMKLLLQGVPELLDITDEINDLFSFYKESIVGTESDTFVYQKSRVDGISVRQTLQTLCNSILRRRSLIWRIFEDDPLLQSLASEYVLGQVQFYLSCERYRLSDLDWGN
ncbi:hypothetical protein BDV59DRAFT_55757 [Aspergillus ambiguus]|uniref:uncharacterized protein n=1 Tax=Aspergillus ambiguus TaxID=176160 RepID=UPI003CCD864F